MFFGEGVNNVYGVSMVNTFHVHVNVCMRVCGVFTIVCFFVWTLDETGELTYRTYVLNKVTFRFSVSDPSGSPVSPTLLRETRPTFQRWVPVSCSSLLVTRTAEPTDPGGDGSVCRPPSFTRRPFEATRPGPKGKGGRARLCRSFQSGL